MSPLAVALLILVSVLIGAKLSPEQAAFYAGAGAMVFIVLELLDRFDG